MRLGAGVRYSTYGATVSNPAYWVGVGRRMAAKFPGSVLQAIWIVSNVNGQGTQLTFPGASTDPLINYSIRDRNEAALTLFDEAGGEVWLQLEPGHAPVEQLIDIVLDRYGHHPSVIGVGIDVEWHRSVGNTPEGEPVTDEMARSWVAAVRRHEPRYRVFLKHWDGDWMPPTERVGLVFIDDSQEHGSMEALVAEFEAWGRRFAPSPVGYQYGYASDERWWKTLDDPAAGIGHAVLARTPNTAGLYWVDFTALQVFPER